MQLPEQYRPFYRSFIRLACWMVFFALLSGILFQESTRKVTFTGVGPGIHWESVYHLALVHGHIFLIGVLIPVATLVLMQFALMLDGKPLSKKLLDWGGWLYHVGAGVTVALMLYKGYHYAISVRMGQTDFAVIEQSYFAGQHLIRQIVYGLSHVALSAGLVVLTASILRSLPHKAKSA